VSGFEGNGSSTALTSRGLVEPLAIFSSGDRAATYSTMQSRNGTRSSRECAMQNTSASQELIVEIALALDVIKAISGRWLAGTVTTSVEVPF
jgi:hypothetical protein